MAWKHDSMPMVEFVYEDLTASSMAWKPEMIRDDKQQIIGFDGQLHGMETRYGGGWMRTFVDLTASSMAWKPNQMGRHRCARDSI